MLVRFYFDISNTLSFIEKNIIYILHMQKYILVLYKVP